MKTLHLWIEIGLLVLASVIFICSLRDYLERHRETKVVPAEFIADENSFRSAQQLGGEAVLGNYFMRGSSVRILLWCVPSPEGEHCGYAVGPRAAIPQELRP